MPQLLKPMCLELALCYQGGHHSKKPEHHGEEKPPLAATRESPLAPTKSLPCSSLPLFHFLRIGTSTFPSGQGGKSHSSRPSLFHVSVLVLVMRLRRLIRAPGRTQQGCAGQSLPAGPVTPDLVCSLANFHLQISPTRGYFQLPTCPLGAWS